MFARKTLHRIGHEWLVALASYALLVAPFGCQFQSELLRDLVPFAGGGTTAGDSQRGTLDTTTAGLFLNQDTTDPLMVAGRNAAGDAFFVYGKRLSNGPVGKVDSILLETAAGERSFIVFELGRPVHVQGADGSNVHIAYDEVSPTRLAATATVYDAPSGATQTVAADVDLRQAAVDVAALVEQVTGLELVVTMLPTDGTAKPRDRAVGPLLTALAVVPMIIVSQLLVVIMGQVMAAVYDTVMASLQAAVLAAFAPVFLFASLLGEVTVEVHSLPLLDIFIELPEPPQIEITIE